MLDVDDLVSNVCGAALGLLIYRLLCKADKHRWAAWVMLIAGFVGCIITAIRAAKSSIDVKVTKEFQFSVSSVAVDDGEIDIEGECFLYDQATPTYTLIIDGSEASTTVEDKKFRATVDHLDEKAEAEIRFKGYSAMPTGVWIKPSTTGFAIEYVAGEIPVIKGLPESAVLKAWNEEYDTLVYQEGDVCIR